MGKEAPSVQDFEVIFRQLFVTFLVTVNSWFQIDISQGIITLKLDENKSFGAEVYAHSLGMDVADDVKYIYAYQLLHALLEGMRVKSMGRQELDVRFFCAVCLVPVVASHLLELRLFFCRLKHASLSCHSCSPHVQTLPVG
jgi:hypothetical protein